MSGSLGLKLYYNVKTFKTLTWVSVLWIIFSCQADGDVAIQTRIDDLKIIEKTVRIKTRVSSFEQLMRKPACLKDELSNLDVNSFLL